MRPSRRSARFLTTPFTRIRIGGGFSHYELAYPARLSSVIQATVVATGTTTVQATAAATTAATAARPLPPRLRRPPPRLPPPRYRLRRCPPLPLPSPRRVATAAITTTASSVISPTETATVLNIPTVVPTSAAPPGPFSADYFTQAANPPLGLLKRRIPAGEPDPAGRRPLFLFHGQGALAENPPT